MFSILFHDNKSRFSRVWLSPYLFELQKALHVDRSGNSNLGVDDIIVFEPRMDTSREEWYVRSHHNGICLVTLEKDYWVCNLFTGQCVKFQDMHEPRSLSYFTRHCVLGCCPVSGQFKVLIVNLDTQENIRLAEIQTLGSGERRSVANPPLIYGKGECFLNGSSHWVDHNFIWSFHFGKEKFSQIPLPNDVNIGSYKKTRKNLSVFETCLCLSCFEWSRTCTATFRTEIDIWIMKEYGVKESWVRQLVLMNDAWSVPPLMHMDKGKILLRSGHELYLYDLQTHVSKRVEFKLNVLSSSKMRPMVFDVSFSRFKRII